MGVTARDAFFDLETVRTLRLGDGIAAALEVVGIIPDRVESWLGFPCGCRERQEKLNALGAWASRVARGRTAGARAFLAVTMGAEETEILQRSDK